MKYNNYYHTPRSMVNHLTPSLESYSVNGYIYFPPVKTQGKHSTIVNRVGIKPLHESNHLLDELNESA